MEKTSIQDKSECESKSEINGSINDKTLCVLFDIIDFRKNVFEFKFNG